MKIKISLIDNDYVVQAKTDLIQNEQDDTFRNFLSQVKEELVTGKTAYLEIDDPEKDSVTLEVSQAV